VPLSSDPDARSRQLDNLRAGAGSGDGGLQRARSHGAYARLPTERVDAKVLEVAEAIGADAPVRADDGGLPAADTIAARQLAEALCRLDDIDDYLRRRGWEDDDGKERPVLAYEGQLRRHVLDLLRELGMTPAARAKLGLDLVRAAGASDRLDADLAASREAWAQHDQTIDATEAS
jgi:hypothetical protein